MSRSKSAKFFENRPVKRSIYRGLIARMQSYNDKGSIVSLGGPAIETHYKEMAPLLRKRSELLFAEIDRKMIREERLVKRIKDLSDSRVIFYEGDVRHGILDHYIIKDGWYHKHVLFDMDFCRTANTIIRELNFLGFLDVLAKSKLPRKGGFWLVLTFCRWGDIESCWSKSISKIIDIFHDNGWRLSVADICPYAEKRSLGTAGTSMVTMHFRFHWDYGSRPVSRNSLEGG